MEQQHGFERQVLSDLAVLKVQMEQVVGGTQPGRLHTLEQRVERHELYLQRTRGFAAAMGVLVTVINILIDLIRK